MYTDKKYIKQEETPQGPNSVMFSTILKGENLDEFAAFSENT
jgi:hypothetical protein